jgi:bacteriorhodopsin
MKKIIAFVIAASPALALAQQPITDINSAAQKATNIGNLFVGILISFAVLWIIFNVVRYLIAGGDEDRKKGGWAIFYGIVGLFVILSIWGLVAILKNTFRTQDQINSQQINQATKLPTPDFVP